MCFGWPVTLRSTLCFAQQLFPSSEWRALCMLLNAKPRLLSEVFGVLGCIGMVGSIGLRDGASVLSALNHMKLYGGDWCCKLGGSWSWNCTVGRLNFSFYLLHRGGGARLAGARGLRTTHGGYRVRAVELIVPFPCEVCLFDIEGRDSSLTCSTCQKLMHLT